MIPIDSLLGNSLTYSRHEQGFLLLLLQVHLDVARAQRRRRIGRVVAQVELRTRGPEFAAAGASTAGQVQPRRHGVAAATEPAHPVAENLKKIK